MSDNSLLFKVCQGIVTCISIGIPVLLAFTGALGIKESSSRSTKTATSLVFMGLYMIAFAGTLFFYEILKIMPQAISAFTDSLFKKNFGFLYGPNGRGAYTLMIGVFAFGLDLKSPKGLSVATAVVVGAWGCFIVLLNLAVAGFFPPESKYVPN